jgi:hypothetical protein
MIYLFSIDSQRRITVGGPVVHACRSETALGCTMREAGWESFACFTCFACCLSQYRYLFTRQCRQTAVWQTGSLRSRNLCLRQCLKPHPARFDQLGEGPCFTIETFDQLPAHAAGQVQFGGRNGRITPRLCPNNSVS